MIKLFFKFSIGSWLSAAISFFTTPVVTALIIPDEFGKASMYTLAFNLVMQVALLGCDQSFVRKFYQQLTKEYQSRLLFNSILIPALLGLLIGGLIFLFGNTLGHLLVNANSIEFTVLLSVSIIIGVFERFAMMLLRMKKQAIAFSLLRILFAVINFVVIFYYATSIKKDFFAIIYGNLSALLVCTIIAVLMVKDLWKMKNFDSPLLKEILRYGFPFLPTFLASWVFEGIDKIALRHYASFYEIGLFSAAYKFVVILAILQTAFSTFWTPVAFEMYEKHSEEAKETFSKVLAYLSGALFICGAGIILFKDVLIIIFEKSYHSASSIMPFLLLVPVMYTISEITVGGINYKNKTYWHLLIAVVSALFNYLLNIFLVPEYGARGAAISTGLSYVLFFYARTFISNRLFPLRINFVKLNLSVMLFILICFLNTFYPKVVFTYISTTLAIFMFLLLYRIELGVFLKCIGQKIKPKTLAVQK